jgi:hypothetical protein
MYLSVSPKKKAIMKENIHLIMIVDNSYITAVIRNIFYNPYRSIHFKIA